MSNLERSFTSKNNRPLPPRERVSIAPRRQPDTFIPPPSIDAFRANSQHFRNELERLGSALDEQTYFDALKAEELEEQDRRLGADYDARIEREMREEERRARDAKIPRLPENWRDIREQRAIEKTARELQARIDAEIAANPDDFDNGNELVEFSPYDGQDSVIDLTSNADLARFDSAPTFPPRRAEISQNSSVEELTHALPNDVLGEPRAQERAQLRRENVPDIKIPHIPKAIKPLSEKQISELISDQQRERNELAINVAQKKFQHEELEQLIASKQAAFKEKFGVDPLAHQLKARSLLRRIADSARLGIKDLVHGMTGADEPTSADALNEIKVLDQRARRLFDEVGEGQARLDVLDAELKKKPFGAPSPDRVGRRYASSTRIGTVGRSTESTMAELETYGKDSWRDRERAYRRIGGVIGHDEALWQDASPDMAAAGAAFMDTGDDHTRLAEARIMKNASSAEGAHLWDSVTSEHAANESLAAPVAEVAPARVNAHTPTSAGPELKRVQPSPEASAIDGAPPIAREGKRRSIPDTRDENIEADNRPTPQEDMAAKAVYTKMVERAPGRSDTFSEKDAYINKAAMKELNDAIERDPILLKMRGGSKAEQTGRERIVKEMKKEFSRHLERELKLAYHQEIGGDENSAPEQVQMRIRNQISELLNGFHTWKSVETSAKDTRQAIIASLGALENIIRPAKGGLKDRTLKMLQQELEKPFIKAESRYIAGFSQDGADILKRAERWQDALEEIVGLTQHAIDILEAHPSGENMSAAESILDQLLNNLRDTVAQHRDPEEAIKILKSELQFQSNTLTLPLLEEIQRRAV